MSDRIITLTDYVRPMHLLERDIHVRIAPPSGNNVKIVKPDDKFVIESVLFQPELIQLYHL